MKFLPPDPAMRMLGIPNRVFYVLLFSIFSVAVEVLLWAGDVFHWEYWWWNFPNVTLIVLLGYATFFAMAAWVYDMRDRGSSCGGRDPGRDRHRADPPVRARAGLLVTAEQLAHLCKR